MAYFERQTTYLQTALLVDELPEIVNAQSRYRTTSVPALVTQVTPDSFALELLEPQFAVTPGQSVVLYDGARLLGGGFIRTDAVMTPRVALSEAAFTG